MNLLFNYSVIYSKVLLHQELVFTNLQLKFVFLTLKLYSVLELLFHYLNDTMLSFSILSSAVRRVAELQMKNDHRCSPQECNYDTE